MPILSAEPAFYPESLFETALGAGGDGRWRVVHTKPRQEKSLARQLHEKGVPFFLPLIPKRARIRGKIMESYLPLFGGYVFLLGNEEDHLFAKMTRRVARTLEVSDQAALWGDLRQIHRLIATGVAIRSEDQLTPGSPVEIQSGPLAGLRGVIVKSATGNRFVVKVDFIQRGASVLMDESSLARVIG
jgi:transcription antitermination factor NusG